MAADVADVVALLKAPLQPDDIVLGGGSVKELKELPPGCRAGDNANAFVGGFRLWQEPRPARRPSPRRRARKILIKGENHDNCQTDRASGLESARRSRREGPPRCTCASSSPTIPSAASA